jgi:hypothetical protein
VSLKGLSGIGGGTLGNQAEASAPSFISKLMQLSIPLFRISRLDLDLA